MPRVNILDSRVLREVTPQSDDGCMPDYELRSTKNPTVTTAAQHLLTSTGLVLGNPEGVEDFSGVVGDGGLGFDRVTVDGDGDVA